MAKLGKVELIVKEILEEVPLARKDDMYLYFVYIDKKIGADCIETVFNDSYFRKLHDISPYHSVARCRRRLQTKYEHLKPSKEIQDIRLNETSDYVDYAIDGYSSNFMNFINSHE